MSPASGTEPPLAEAPLFLLDYDGTLAEISLDPDQALPYEGAVGLLGELASLFPVRVISGRRVSDLARLLPVPELVAVGVHGMEQGRLGGEVETRLGEVERRLMDGVRDELPETAGIRVEDKRSAIALHYRGAEDEDAVVASLRSWSSALPEGLETVWGKKVVEVRPSGYDKGRAALELAAEHPGSTPVMIGDDTTDEDAFRALPHGVTVKVGEGDSLARYRLPDVAAVVSYLGDYLP